MFKVMLVDDIEIMRRSIKRLKLWGEESGFIICEEAKDGVEALDKLAANAIDLVITDIRMPRMDGIELMKRIREKQLPTCVVMLSDYTEFSYAREGFAYGAFDYLGKPIDKIELTKVLQRVREHIANKQQKEEALEKLREIAAERIETFYPEADVEQLIKLINDGNENAVVMAEALVHTVASAVNKDNIKTALMLKKMLSEIVNGLLGCHQWIDNFLDIDEVKNIDFTKYDQYNDMVKELSNCLNYIILTVNKFARCDIANNTIRNVCNYVLNNVDADISVKNISENLFINRNYLSDMFKQKLGMSLVEYLTMIKMERAKRYITCGEFKNYEIADKLGFKDIEYFSKLFKKYTGMTPTEFKNQQELNNN